MYQEFVAKLLQYRATRATSPKVSKDHHHHHHQNLNLTWSEPCFARNNLCCCLAMTTSQPRPCSFPSLWLDCLVHVSHFKCYSPLMLVICTIPLITCIRYV